MSTKSIVTLGLICLVGAIAATPASAYSIRYQNWSQVPDLITAVGGPSYISEFRTSGQDP
jgi:hypothetical protein